MGRPKRRRGGGRVTPKATRPAGQRYHDLGYDYCDRDYKYEVKIEPPDRAAGDDYMLELWTEDAEQVAGTCTDIDETDRWASSIQCGILSEWSPDGVEPSKVLSHAARKGGPAGVALAAAISVYGAAHARSKARRLLRRLAQNGADVPAWVDALGEAEPVRAVGITDQWGEGSALIVDYERPDGSMQALSVSIDPFCGGMAHRFSLDAAGTGAGTASVIADVTVATGQLRGPGGLDDPSCTVEAMSLADARAVIEAGLRVYDTVVSAPQHPEDLDGPDLNDDLRALVEQRIGLLPGGGRAPARPMPDPDEIADLIADFVSEPIRLGEHIEEFGDLLHTMLGFAVTCRDRDILRWTPPRVTAFIEDWIPEHGMYCDECGTSHEHPPDEEWLTTVESAFPRWLRFAADRRGLDSGALDANLAAARKSLRRMRRHATSSPVRLA